MTSLPRTTRPDDRREGPRAPDGTRHGDAIPGSRFYRSFCAGCGEPMRMDADRLDREVLCNDCDPPHIGVGSPFAALNSAENDPDAWLPSFLAE